MSQVPYSPPTPVRAMLRRLALVTLVGLCGVPGARAAPALQASGASAGIDQSPADDAFLAMRDAIKRGDLDGAAMLGRRVLALEPDYPLAAYIDYYTISVRLKNPADSLPDDVPRNFIAHNAGTLVGDLALHDWLLALGRRGDFATFGVELPDYVGNDDPQITCLALAARYEQTRRVSAPLPDGMSASVEPLLGSARAIGGDGCYQLAVTLAADGHLDSEDVWRWIRLASDANNLPAVKRYVALLPDAQAPKLDALAGAYDNSALWLGKRTGQAMQGQEQLVLLALTRMARAAPESTAPLFERSWAPRLPPSARLLVWAELGASAARHFMPQASEWTTRSLAAQGLSEEILAAQARGALHERQWDLLTHIIEKMPGEMLKPTYGDGAWVYWQARACQARGDTGTAATLYASIAGQYQFYGQLATEELGEPLLLPPPAAPVSEVEIAAVQDLAGFRRAFKFYQLGMRGAGNQEWNFTLRGMGDRQLLASAEWARRNDVFDRAINTADRTRIEHDFAVRFLTPYLESMQPKAIGVGLSLDWVYGLIRQESRFATVARSSVGAAGLMQLMPGTASYVARKIGLVDYQPSQVSNLDTNITLGTSYLRMVLDQLDNQEVLATAAYNAGPGRARSWRASLAAPVEGAIYAETIPFNETRDYVKRVMSNAIYYSMLLEPAGSHSLKARMGIISPAAMTGDGGGLP